VLFFNYDQTILDLVACGFPTNNPKLSVTLLNFTESDKAAMRQNVEGFHVIDRAQTSKRVTQIYREGSPLSNGGGWRCHVNSLEDDNSINLLG
jgi:hypothetical protein